MEIKGFLSIAVLIGTLVNVNGETVTDRSERDMLLKVPMLLDAIQKLDKAYKEQQITIERLEMKIAEQQKEMAVQKQTFKEQCTDIRNIKDLLHEQETLSLENTKAGHLGRNDLARPVRLTPNSEVISFYAYLSKSIESPVPDHDIHFDTVITNNGDGYKNYSGSFIVPAGGVYVFVWSISGRGNVPIQLTVNGVVRGRLDTYTGSHDATNTASGFVVVNVNTGDVVLMRTHPTFSPSGRIRSDEWIQSEFGGWKLY